MSLGTGSVPLCVFSWASLLLFLMKICHRLQENRHLGRDSNSGMDLLPLQLHGSVPELCPCWGLFWPHGSWAWAQLGPRPKTLGHAGPGPEPHSQSPLWLHRSKALAPLPPRLTLAMRVQAGHGLPPPRPPLSVPTPVGMPVEAGTPASLHGHVCSRIASGKRCWWEECKQRWGWQNRLGGLLIDLGGPTRGVGVGCGSTWR